MRKTADDVPELPARCECGWILPAGFQVMCPGPTLLLLPRPTPLLLPAHSQLFFACGNCGAWRTCALSPRGGATTANAAGFDLKGIPQTGPDKRN
jgi:hypothetical protein